MVSEIVRSTRCRATADEAFAYVADYRHVPQWVLGLTEFCPVGAQAEGLGAVFDAGLHLGVRLSARVRVDEFVEGRRMGFVSTHGFSVRSRWRFEECATARGPVTTITVRVSYRLPFGPAGLALARLIEPFAQQTLAVSGRQLTAAIQREVASPTPRVPLGA